MIIAVNTRFLAGDRQGYHGNFIFECLTRLIKKYPQHQFICIFDRPCDEDFLSSKNLTSVVTGPQAKNSLLLQYWFNYKVPAVLRKYKADVFVSMDGICSLRTKLPQCLLLPDTSFLQNPQFFKKDKLRFYKKFTAKFLAKAGSLATVSESSKTVMVDQYKINAGKVDVVYGGIDDIFRPISAEEKEIIKETYADGKEYFLFTGNIDLRNNLMNLLKAFSFFKKRQKSNMMLLIAGQQDENYEQFTKDLKTFKFRNEVRQLGELPKEELTKITAAAYAFVYPSFYEDFAIPPLQAMRCEVPVITSNTGSLQELCGEAALYAVPADFKDIAEKMMLVFKDENKAKELIKAGKTQVQRYHWDKTASLLWQTILKATNK